MIYQNTNISHNPAQSLQPDITCLVLFFSDGAGRSGVYLAIDANIELSEEDGVFDVYGYLKKMRLQRRGLIETMVRLIPLLFTLWDSNQGTL